MHTLFNLIIIRIMRGITAAAAGAGSDAQSVARVQSRQIFAPGRCERAIVVPAFVLAAVVSALIASPADAGLLDKLTWKAEKHIGKSTVEEMRNTYGFIEDPVLSSYVSDMGQSIAAVSHRTDIPYEFHIVDSEQVNAFAAPGGFVFVTRGMMEQVESDDELAAVVGHEVGHVAANHGKKRVKQIPLLIAGSILLNANASEKTSRIAGAAFSLMQLHYSREDEYQADHLGAEYSFNAGYDPAQMLTLFHKLEREHPTGDLNKLDVSLMSHPKTPNRMAAFSRTEQMADTSENLMSIAGSYEDRYFYHEAAEHYREAIEADPGNEHAAVGAARSYAALGMNGEAARWYEYALDINPDNEEALAGLDSLEDPGDEDLASFARLPDATDRDITETVEWLDTVIPEIAGEASASKSHEHEIMSRSADLERAFYKNLRGYSEIAKSVESHDEYRVSVLDNASLFFGGMFQTLAELESDGYRLAATTREAARRAREMRYYISHSDDLDKDAIWAAEDLAYVAENLTREAPRIRKALNEAVDQTQAGFIGAHNSLARLGETFDIDNRHSLFMVSTEMNENIRSGLSHLESAHRKARSAQDSLMEQRLRLKRAVLNFNAAMLSAAEENVYRKMMERRFGLTGDLIARLKTSGLGYADMALLAGRSHRTGVQPLEILESYNPEETYIDDFFISRENDAAAAADSLLLHFAANDMLSLTQKNSLINLELEPDPAAADILAAYSGEADDMLARAAEAIDDGEYAEAAAIIDERGRSEPATALSHLLLGLAQRGIGEDYGAALDNFKYAADKHIESVYPHLLMANTFSDLERYEDALNEYASALQYSPENPVVLASEAYAMAMSGDLEEALTTLESVLHDHGYAHAGIYMNLGLLYYEQGMIEESIEMLAEAAELAPGNRRLARMVERLRAS